MVTTSCIIMMRAQRAHTSGAASSSAPMKAKPPLVAAASSSGAMKVKAPLVAAASSGAMKAKPPLVAAASSSGPMKAKPPLVVAASSSGPMKAKPPLVAAATWSAPNYSPTLPSAPTAEGVELIKGHRAALAQARAIPTASSTRVYATQQTPPIHSRGCARQCSTRC